MRKRRRQLRNQKQLALSALAAALLITAPAFADDATNRVRAKEAYDRGLDAHKHGEMARAAKEFAAADAYVPSAFALQAALDAAIDADDVSLGAELLERAKREPAPPGLASSITAASIKFGGRAGKLYIKCPRSSFCTAKIDDNPAAVDRIVWAGVGPRTVSVQVDSGSAQTKSVEVTVDDTIEVTAARGAPLGVKSNSAVIPAAEAAAPSRRESEGLSPIVFYAAAGVTVIAAGVTTYLMVHTASKHGDFTDAGCDKTASDGCSSLADSGKSAQSAANAGLVVTVAAALVTTVLGVAFVNWHRDAPPGSGQLRVGPNGMALTF